MSRVIKVVSNIEKIKRFMSKVSVISGKIRNWWSLVKNITKQRNWLECYSKKTWAIHGDLCSSNCFYYSCSTSQSSIEEPWQKKIPCHTAFLNACIMCICVCARVCMCVGGFLFVLESINSHHCVLHGGDRCIPSESCSRWPLSHLRWFSIAFCIPHSYNLLVLWIHIL